jgi:hypothetical protein
MVDFQWGTLRLTSLSYAARKIRNKRKRGQGAQTSVKKGNRKDGRLDEKERQPAVVEKAYP